MMIMKKIEIYDPAMCCSTGVCGPSIDPELMRVAATISSLKEKGITIKRFGLATEPQAFVTNQAVNELLMAEGAEVLPITMVAGKVAKTKVYPTNEELSEWLGIAVDGKPAPQASCCCGPEGCC